MLWPAKRGGPEEQPVPAACWAPPPPGGPSRRARLSALTTHLLGPQTSREAGMPSPFLREKTEVPRRTRGTLVSVSLGREVTPAPYRASRVGPGGRDCSRSDGKLQPLTVCFINMHMYTHTHAHGDTHIHICMHAQRTHACTQQHSAQGDTRVHTNMHTVTHMHMDTPAYAHTPRDTHMHCMHTLMHLDIHTHVRAHTYMQ